MTDRAFQFGRRIDPSKLLDCVSRFFDLIDGQAMIYEDTRELDAPFEDKPAGKLWRTYEDSPIRIYLSQFDESKPMLLGWFAIETADPKDNAFDDRPLARFVAKELEMFIIFRDPVPYVWDSPYVEGAQIGVDPDGLETELWVVDVTNEGEDVSLIMTRDFAL